MISANLSAIFYLVSGVLFILALRGLSSPETSRQGNLFGILGMVIAITVTFLSTGNFSSGFIFVLIFFYRIAEHGTDRSAQILIFLLFVELLFFNYAEKNFNNNVFKIFIFLGIIISLKSFYLLYLIMGAYS